MRRMDEESPSRTVPAPADHDPWYAVWDAHLRAEPLRVRITGPTTGGWNVVFETLAGRLAAEGAPAEWSVSTPTEVDVWVLNFDRDAPSLELVAWSPRTGPT